MRINSFIAFKYRDRFPDISFLPPEQKKIGLETIIPPEHFYGDNCLRSTNA